MTILSIEDSPSDQAVLDLASHELGYTVIATSSVSEAVDLMIKGLRPNLILADLNMPVLCGLAIIEEMKQLDIPEIPVVAFSGHVQKEEKSKSILRGAAAAFEKPIKYLDFRNCVSFFVKKYAKAV